MKRFFALLGICAALSLGAADALKVFPPAHAATLQISAKSIPLNPENPAQIRVGELVYRGGLELRSANKDFGGISGMRLWHDGKTILAVSDAGSWISFKLIEKKGQLIGATGIALAPILDIKGIAGTKKGRDAEAITVQIGSSSIIAFEGQNALWRYFDIDPTKPKTFSAPAIAQEMPDYMKLWPNNGGPEVYDSGLFSGSRGASYFAPKPQSISIAEDAFDDNGTTPGYLEHPEKILFAYNPPPGFKPTDAQLISDKDALVLHRRFSPMTGVAASIGLVDLVSASTGAKITPREIARLEPPMSVDNMEGISYIERGGKKYIYIISDDNFSGLQRTLILKFEWTAKK